MKKLFLCILGFSSILFHDDSSAAQEFLTGKVGNIEIDYRGWYSFELTPGDNQQGCSTNRFILNEKDMKESVKSAMLAVLLSADATNSPVQINVINCDPTTDMTLVWQVRKITN